MVAAIIDVKNIIAIYLAGGKHLPQEGPALCGKRSWQYQCLGQLIPALLQVTVSYTELVGVTVSLVYAGTVGTLKFVLKDKALG
jgi:hypothetical protein